MGIYSFALAGSNYFAPIICGFIAEYQGWRWVFYWPAIFMAFVFVFLFLFMEESNYNRRINTGQPAISGGVTGNGSSSAEEEGKPSVVEATQTENAATTLESPESYGPPKTFLQKLSLWHPSPEVNMLHRAARALRLLGWPVIFYAGFSYGSYLIWFNVLNATASIILSGSPYHFSSSMVGVSYTSCFVGVIVGSCEAAKRRVG